MAIGNVFAVGCNKSLNTVRGISEAGVVTIWGISEAGVFTVRGISEAGIVTIWGISEAGVFTVRGISEAGVGAVGEHGPHRLVDGRHVKRETQHEDGHDHQEPAHTHTNRLKPGTFDGEAWRSNSLRKND